MANPQALYQEVILDHNKKPRNYGVVENANRHSEGVNPLCGDRISLSLRLESGVIGAIAFQGESCAICKASSSMMTTNVKGKSPQEAETMIAEFRAMATGQLDPQSTAHHLGRLTVFSGIAQLPSRVKCAVLPWHALHAALENQDTASSEGADDPAHGHEAPGAETCDC
jgi:nitrogen fixation NifU-like protein